MRMKKLVAQFCCLFFCLFIILKSIIRMKIFLVQTYSLFLFIYYCKKYHKNENISGADLFFVSFSLLLEKVSHEWKYFRDKFIVCSFLFVIVKGILRIKIFLAQIYCWFLSFIIVKSIMRIKIFLAQVCGLFDLVYYCKNYHTNKNISGANLFLVPFCLLL